MRNRFVSPGLHFGWFIYIKINVHSFTLFLKILCNVCISSRDSGADSPTCSNGVTPPNKNKSHNKYTGISSASSSPSSSPSSVNYSESNSTDSTKSQPHSATSNQETRSVCCFFFFSLCLLLTMKERTVCFFLMWFLSFILLHVAPRLGHNKNVGTRLGFAHSW